MFLQKDIIDENVVEDNSIQKDDMVVDEVVLEHAEHVWEHGVEHYAQNANIVEDADDNMVDSFFFNYYFLLKKIK